MSRRVRLSWLVLVQLLGGLLHAQAESGPSAGPAAPSQRGHVLGAQFTCIVHRPVSSGADLARHEGASQRQLGRGQRERLARQRFGHAVDFVQHLAGLDLGHVVLGVALAVAHAHFGRLLRNRLVREDADEDAATALDVARDRAACGFDLARRQAAALGGLQAEFAERHRGAARGDAGVAALLLLAVLATSRLQHGLFSFSRRPRRRLGRDLAHALDGGLARVAVGVCGRCSLGRRRCGAVGARRARGRAARRPGGARARLRGADAAGALRVRRWRGFGRGRRVVAAQRVALVDPDLDADDAVGGLGFGEAVVDVGAQRVQRHAAFAVPLAARDFDAVQAAGDMILMPCAPRRIAFCIARFIARRNMMRFSSCCVIESAISCASISGLRTSSMFTATGTPKRRRQFGLQVLDVLALLADHHARTRRVDGDAGVLGRALDQDARHGGVLQLRLQVLAHLQVLGQHARRSCGLLAYQRDAQLRVTGRRKPVGWIFCPMDLFSWPCQLPTVT